MNFRIRLCGCLSVLMLLLSACSGGGGGGGTHGGNGPVTPPPPPAGAPVVESNPDAVHLTTDTKDINSTKEQTVTIENSSSNPVVISSLILEKDDHLSIGADKDKCTHAILNLENPKCTYTIVFTFTPGNEIPVTQKKITINYTYDQQQKNAAIITTAEYGVVLPPPTSSEIKVFINKGSSENQNPEFKPNGSGTLTLQADYYDPKDIPKPTSDGQLLYTTSYGSSGSIVLYNISKKPIVFSTKQGLPVFITGDTDNPNAVNELKIDVHSCGSAFSNKYNNIVLNTGLDIDGICAFEINYFPMTNTNGNLKKAKLNLTYLSPSENNKEVLLQFNIEYGTKKELPAAVTYPATDFQAFLQDKTKRLAFYNNCTEPIWVENKFLSGTFNLNRKVTPKIKSGDFFDYDSYINSTIKTNNSLSEYNMHNGLPSLNIFAKFGCNDDGSNCKIGQHYDGLQVPDNDTKFEITFGCDTLRPAGTPCIKNPSQKDADISPSTYFDGTFVDGFTYNIATDTFYTANEKSSACFSTMESALQPLVKDDNNCPTLEDLTTKPSRWAVLNTTTSNIPDSRWDWTDAQPPLGWSADEIGAVAKIGRTAWNNGISDIRGTVSGWNTKSPTFNACDEPNGDGKCTSKDFLVFPQNDTLQALCPAPSKYNPSSGWTFTSNPTRKPTESIPLTNLDLSLQYQNIKLGCASPGRYVSTSTQFSGLGNDCFYVGSLFSSKKSNDNSYLRWPESAYWYSRYVDRPGNYLSACSHDNNDGNGIQNCLVPNSSPTVYATTLNNIQIMFANPFSNDDLIQGKLSYPNEYKSPSAFIYQNLVDFCTRNPSFCSYLDTKDNGIATYSSGGLANIVANMGPISSTKYVKNVKAHGGGNYSWQYDDYSATRRCDDPNSKYVVVFCGKSDVSRNAFPEKSSQQSANKKLKTISKRLP